MYLPNRPEPPTILTSDDSTGFKNGFDETAHRAFTALDGGGLIYCLIGAAALAVWNLPRNTQALDFAVISDDEFAAVGAMRYAGFVTNLGFHDSPDPKIVFVDPATKVEVNLFLPQNSFERLSTKGAYDGEFLGAKFRVASLEHLLLNSLVSNNPKHLDDFATVARSEHVDLKKAESVLLDTQPELLPLWKTRLDSALKITIHPDLS